MYRVITRVGTFTTVDYETAEMVRRIWGGLIVAW